MDSLNCVKCQKNPKLRDMMGIFGMFNEEKDKKPNSNLLLQTKKRKNVQEAVVRCNSNVFHFLERERESTFSLDFRPIGSSVFDGSRSKVILRGKGYAWALIWWSSDNSKR